MDEKYDSIVVGGGLAGLVSTILLARKGQKVLLIEKKSYPFHKVCGEYISNEVRPFLEREGLFPHVFEPSQLDVLKLSDIRGNTAYINLLLGGFGISRYQLDNFLYQKALASGAHVKTNTEVSNIHFEKDLFIVHLKGGNQLVADFVIGAYGKRAKLDKTFDRPFTKQQSPFIGIKYHAQLAYPKNEIGLYNFPRGYCGVSHVEDGMVNICYLSKRNNLKQFGDIKSMEENILFQNPLLKKIFQKAVWIREKPEVINEISFQRKSSVENHMLMVGDTAGLITPLCGNGMAMAIHGAKIVCDLILKYQDREIESRAALDIAYSEAWNNHFSKRLWIGRNTQNLFGNQFRSNVAVKLINKLPTLGKQIILQTHGEVF